MARYDIVIKGGTIVDGTQIPRYRGDIGIKDGVIREIGFISAAEGERVLDADGLIVAPGAIDLHTHYDAQLFWDPYCSISSWHGITSVVIGNCGFGFAPVKPEMRERSMLSMTRVEAIPLAAMKEGLPWTWETFPEFLDAVDHTPKSINILPYVPVAPLLIYVMGLERAKAGDRPTERELDLMCRMLDESLDAGGCGWSAQRLPPDGWSAAQRDYDGGPMPTDVMHFDICRAFAEVLGRRNDGFIQTIVRTDDPKRDEAQIEELAKVSGRPILYNVVQVFDHQPQVHREVLGWLHRCHERGLRVYGQGVTTDAGFAFTFEDWNLFDDSEAWCQATTGSLEERLQKLSDPARRKAMIQQPPRAATGPLEGIVVCGPKSEETKQWLDLTVGEIARRMNKHPVDAMLDIAVADKLETEFYAQPPNVDSTLLKEVIDDPHVLLGVSDGGAHTKFFTAGRYPTETIARMVREHRMCSLEHAHWRLSALPAMVAGFHDRGVIKKGAPADIMVYDYENLKALPGEIAHDYPGGEWRRVQRAQGYRWILVNGQVTIEDDRQTDVRSGRLLRHGTGVRRPQALAAE
jgi:N-acyl-D-aspartate/D-glutamate deacylase